MATSQEEPSMASASTTSALGVLDHLHSMSQPVLSKSNSMPNPILNKRAPFRSSSRPSTAPGKEKVSLLPSIPSCWARPNDEPYIHDSRISKHPPSLSHLQTFEESESDVCLGQFVRHDPCFSFSPVSQRTGNLPSPFDEDSTTPPSDLNSPLTSMHSEYDWATFINAYATGQWDPHRTPNPPRSCQPSTNGFAMPSEALGSGPLANDRDILSSYGCPEAKHDVIHTPSTHQHPTPERSTTIAPAAARSSTSTISISPSSSLRRFRPAAPPNLPLPTHRMRSSFSTSSAPPPSPGDPASTAPSNVHLNPEAQTTAATLRWAASRVDISPLALPSPEHELTDPMRGFTATLPGSHPPEFDPGPEHLTTPGGTRKPRLASFWHGTTTVDHASLLHNETKPSVSSSHSDTAPEHTKHPTPPHQDCPVPFPTTMFASPEHLAAATAPVPRHDSSESSTGDYFGSLPNGDVLATGASDVPNGHVHVNGYAAVSPQTMTAPALPRRVCLTRQTSSPLPDSSPREPKLGGRVASESITSIRANRAAKEEQMFSELGYLAPPNPPDELERRRALYKFNIWNTGPDLNFDRIAHLAKLVFSTKGVVISLIDGNEQWHKSECKYTSSPDRTGTLRGDLRSTIGFCSGGIQSTTTARAHSICAHAILQQGDEPMVILDTHKDWRFTKNPAVTGAPHVRFYAGAPLRTADGYNIGALAVICDTPREDFSPRQKHTLKEFAAIAMREMELWRDKIQLRIRDRIQNSMEQFSRECLEIDTEQHREKHEGPPDLLVGSSMDKVYDRAAKLVKRTLDVEGVIVMDVSHCEVLESMSAEGTVSVNMHFGDPNIQATKRQLSSEEYQLLNAFFAKYPDGKISEGIVPPSFRPFLPTHIQYALSTLGVLPNLCRLLMRIGIAVPIFNIDKRPFALLYKEIREGIISLASKRCSDSARIAGRTRAVILASDRCTLTLNSGVIILSAVLKRRMILADKAKSLFISNISHELRTPLHGILAAAELLGESQLNHSQLSFLQTVQACGTSLVETVNHVLDFTKLSGNSKAGGVDNVINPAKVDLMQLVEDAIDGSWIGYRARSAIMGESSIGSVYSPPKDDIRSSMEGAPRSSASVETVIDIGYRRKNGFVHVVLRELPLTDTDPQDKIKIELAVLDTGKGISQNFLNNQLFHPFSQENPLQTGTGLGLAIVNSIVTSESVGGKVDVWSEEGSGTEIKVTFFADKVDEPVRAPVMEAPHEDSLKLPGISLVGFDAPHEGTQLLKRVLQSVLKGWWGFEVHNDSEHGDIIILNEDVTLVQEATRLRDIRRPFILVTSSRGSAVVMSVAAEHELIGGFCRTLFKPYGPTRLLALLKLCLHAYKMRLGSKSASSPMSNSARPPPPSIDDRERNISGSSIPRRRSDDSHQRARTYPPRPPLGLRSTSVLPITSLWKGLATAPELLGSVDPEKTVPVGSGGSLLKSSLRLPGLSQRRFRVLVVEDNSIVRNLLIKWLSQKGYDFCSAVDGRDGVTTYEEQGPFDVVLLDLSMPNLDGIAATAEIRGIESKRANVGDSTYQASNSARILALTGMSSLEDKRRAFDAGVDGYLVKPVAFKTLDEMFHKMGIV
ncbi:hypothetical protein DXG01_014204 [Tephrocybe rancida]|nr:hypothetical protein DXG01_014204 [Tephrocybe rancida]